LKESPTSVPHSTQSISCFLSSLRVFVSQFDKSHPFSLDERHKSKVLETFLTLTRFPPAVRAFYTLFSQNTPTFEDRAAIAQCTYELCKEIAASHIKPEDLLGESRRLFGSLHQSLVTLKIDARESSIPPFLRLFETATLTCLITNETVFHGVVTTDGGIVEGPLALEYQSFALRKTRSFPFSIAKGDTQTPLERICLYFGGRSRNVVYFSQRFGDCKHDYMQRAPLFNLGKINGFSDGPLAVTAPKDLRSVVAPALTRDSQGNICVYTGIARCKVPPIKYFPYLCRLS